MPSTRAARAVCAVARMAWPMRLFLMNRMTPIASSACADKAYQSRRRDDDQTAGKFPSRQVGISRLRIGAKNNVETLLNDDGDAECRKQRREQIAGDHLCDCNAIEYKTQAPEHRGGDRQQQQRVDAEFAHVPGNVATEHDEVALSKVLDVHHAPH